MHLLKSIRMSHLGVHNYLCWIEYLLPKVSQDIYASIEGFI